MFPTFFPRHNCILAKPPEHTSILAGSAEQERLAFYNASMAHNSAARARRVALAGNLPAGCLPDMPADKGYVLSRPKNFAPLEAALSEARQAFRQYNPGTNKRADDSLEGVRRPDGTWNSAFNKLAMHPDVLAVVSRYFGFLPILYRINLLYSPSDSQVDRSSQFFHLDPEDWKQVKIFVWVEDVDENTGPFILLPADLSVKVRRAIRYTNSRVTDEEMFRTVSEKNLVACTGPAGTMAFCDTSMCFHMGSRAGTRPRHAIMIQYITPFAAVFPMEGKIEKTPLGEKARPPQPTVLEKYLLGIER